MNRLEELWKLENCNVNLDKDIRKIEQLDTEFKNRNIEGKTRKVNKKINIIDNNKEVIKTAILKYENTLSQYEFEIKTLNDKLYKDNITDIKQLEYLSFEKEELKKRIQKIESEMMIYMEEEEILNEKYNSSMETLKRLQKDSEKSNSSFQDEIKLLEEKVKKQKEDIDKISQKINPDFLKQYNSLNRRKKRPIVLIENDTCLGCNMKLPAYQLEDVKDNSKITNCESCGRIMYLRD